MSRWSASVGMARRGTAGLTSPGMVGRSWQALPVTLRYGKTRQARFVSAGFVSVGSGMACQGLAGPSGLAVAGHGLHAVWQAWLSESRCVPVRQERKVSAGCGRSRQASIGAFRIGEARFRRRAKACQVRTMSGSAGMERQVEFGLVAVRQAWSVRFDMLGCGSYGPLRQARRVRTVRSEFGHGQTRQASHRMARLVLARLCRSRQAARVMVRQGMVRRRRRGSSSPGGKRFVAERFGRRVTESSAVGLSRQARFYFFHNQEIVLW